MSTKGPVVERGQAIASGGLGIMPWSTFLDERENVPELRWPESINTYDIMRGDSQIAALLAGFTMPIYRYDWRLEPNGAPDAVVQRLSEDLNLPIVGKRGQMRSRMKRRFSFNRHIREAIGFSMIWGHHYAEQVGEDDGSAWRLRKLAGRMPFTITELAVESDGGLKYIKQNLGPSNPELPVNNLVAYIQNQEPGNWVGRSWLRELYKHWLIKDRLYRVDAMKHERNGMGIPMIEAPQGASALQMQELAALASLYKAGEASGGALPYGAKLRLVGTEGSIPDTVASIKEHDQAMSRRFLLMLMDLGQTATGSRALGSEFSDYVRLGQDCLADWFADIFNEHVIEDAVDWSDGEDVPAPLLVYERDDDPDLSVADFALLVEKNVLTVDEELEDYAREKYAIPALTKPRPAPAAPVVVAPISPAAPAEPIPVGDGTSSAGNTGVSATSPALGAGSAAILPTRKLRRAISSHELASQVNFASIDTSIDEGVDGLLKTWNEDIKPKHVDALAKQIKAATKLSDITRISAPSLGADEIFAVLREGAVAGISQATAEVQAQKVAVRTVKIGELEPGLRARAEAISDLLARSIGDTAARNGARLWTGKGQRVATADAVRDHLDSLSDAFLRKEFTGTYMAGMNRGRFEVFAEAEGEATFYASELLDSNTCDACTAIDGQGFATLAEAEQAYPTGGYGECLGGPNCRGTIVANYDTGPSTDPDDPDLDF